MHRLLQRQLERYSGSGDAPPQDWPSFIAAADQAYSAADQDLRRVERSLDLMSEELNEHNRNLRAEIEQRQKIEEQLQASIRHLRRKNEQISQLNAMGELLQSCSNLDNAYGIIAIALQKLFLTHAGVITIRDETSDALLSVARWGDEAVAMDQQAAAAKLGHGHGKGADAWFARHQETATEHLWIQLSTHGQHIGMIHVVLKNDPRERGADPATDDREQLAQATSDHISLALANLKLQESLRQQTIHDALTGLYNRRHMEVSLEREVRRAQRAARPLGIIMIDIDHFKRFNDNHGHLAGDAVLAALGAFLNRQVRGEDIACRYGGEEFILILPEADLANTLRRAEQICRDVPQTLHVEFEGRSLGEITISVGVSAYPANGKALRDLVQAADGALYQAKRAGRNRVIAAL